MQPRAISFLHNALELGSLKEKEKKTKLPWHRVIAIQYAFIGKLADCVRR